VVDRYAAGEGEGEGGQPRAFVSLNWLLTEEPLDLETELVRVCLGCSISRSPRAGTTPCPRAPLSTLSFP
jgi:hypothetical protein